MMSKPHRAKPTLPVVLLRGWGREQRHWAPLLHEYQDSVNPHSFLFVDCPGAGTEAHRSSPLEMREIAKDVLTRWPVSEGPSHLLAISMGAMLALEVTHLAPERVHSLTLINSSDRCSPFWKRLQVTKLAMELLRADWRYHTREHFILSLTSNLPKGERAQWVEEFQKIPATSPKIFLQQLSAASQFQVPPISLHGDQILLLRSLGDRLVHPDCTLDLARSLNTKNVKTHLWGGHDLPLDDPKWVLEQAQVLWQKLTGV